MQSLADLIVLACLLSGATALVQAAAGPVRRLLEARRRRLSSPAGVLAWPRTALIVPCDGADADELGAALAAWTAQDHPNFEILVVTRDGAAPRVDRLARRTSASGGPPIRQIAAGHARGRAQKNHNLLAAVAATDAEVLAFVDADARPQRPDWLRTMTRPLIDGKRPPVATTTFREVRAPREATPGWLFYKVCTDFQYNAMALFGYYVWGGATAITRENFDALLADAWAETVVDDITAARAFRAAGRHVALVPQGLLVEDHAPQEPTRVFEWCVRQLQFMRWCMPDGFLQALGFYALVTVALVTGIMLWPAALLGVLPTALMEPARAAALAVLAHVVSMAVIVDAYPSRHRLATALMAPLAAAVALRAAVLAIRRPTLVWGGHEYHLGSGGRVRAISRARPALEREPEGQLVS